MTRDLKKAVLLPILLAAAGGDAVRAAVPGVAVERVGPYRLLDELGSGGMGTVYLAEQDDPVLRRVAVKVVHPELATPELLARFHVERQVLALTNHDHIVRLYDAGTTPDGAPWLAMEYVPGEPLTTWCDRHRLDVHERLRLLADVCDAVHHLHELGIQHRDMKPDNVLVVERDGRPVPKIIDLGLATVTGHGPHDDELAGTPTHMAPEQFVLPAHEIDERADVHALGVMLYELVVGALPFATVDWSRPGGVESLACNREPAPPSARLRAPDVDARAVSSGRRTSVRGLRRKLRGQLDRIAQRAVATVPARRHGSARELADALRDHVDRDERRARWIGIAVAAGLTAAAGFLGGALLA